VSEGILLTGGARGSCKCLLLFTTSTAVTKREHKLDNEAHQTAGAKIAVV